MASQVEIARNDHIHHPIDQLRVSSTGLLQLIRVI